MSGIQLNIPEPCHENWQAMTPQEKGRFCSSCRKTVTDFTRMDDREILKHLSSGSSSTCGRFNNDQLNRFLLPSPQPAAGRKPVWSLLLAGLMAGGSASAQEKGRDSVSKGEYQPLLPAISASGARELMGDTVINNASCHKTYDSTITVGMVVMMDKVEKKKPVIRGMVADSDGNPIPFASVQIKDGPAVVAGADGRFAIPVNPGAAYSVHLSAVGYAEHDYVVSADTRAGITLYLERSPDQLAPVEVKGYQTVGKVAVTECLQGIAGGYQITRVVKPVEKIQRTWDSLFVRQKLRAFPNPALRGQSITWQARFSAMGRYHAELLDASGRIVWQQWINSEPEVTSGSIPVSTQWPSGIYWLRISRPDEKKLYHAKVIVQ